MKTYTKANKLNFISMLTLLCLGSFGVIGQGNQQPDWKWQNPLPTGNNLNDVFFVNERIGWCIGEKGAILKSSDGGTSWFGQFSGTQQDLLSISFVDSLTGWVVGQDSTIRKTTDGGFNWKKQDVGFAAGTFRSVHFYDGQIGWIVGGGKILKTTDGGNNWVNQNNGNQNIYTSVYFKDSQIGWTVGVNRVLKMTTDGGSNWQTQIIGDNSLAAIYFSDFQNGWTIGGSSILKTTNGGISWQNQNSGVTRNLNSIYFANNQMGWTVGELGTIRATTDGGTNWQGQNSGSNENLRAVYFFNQEIGWAVGPNGIILKTTNGGNNWIKQNRTVTTNHIYSNFFINNQIGWSVGQNGTILKTYNRGLVWQNQSSGSTNTFSSVFFSNSQTGWVVGSNGTILKTTSGGLVWNAQFSGITHWLRSVYFVDEQNGWIVGDAGTILKTTNGGTNWNQNNSGITTNLNSVKFIDLSTGLAVGNSGRILKTTNGGFSWIARNSGTTANLFSVHFLNSLNAWASGQNAIIRTDNGGQNWAFFELFNTIITSIQFISFQTGYATTQNGTILKSTNSGFTWKTLNTYITPSLNSIYFSDPLHGWACGNNGTILTTNTNNIIDFETPTSLLSGNLYQKLGPTCITSEIPVSGKVIKATPGPFYGYSLQDGSYSLRVPLADSAANFVLQPIGVSSSDFNINTICPPSGQISVIVDTIPDTLAGKDFGLDVTPCHHLDVQVASNFRRRCFKNISSISYQNQGSLSAPDSYILVEFPKWVRPLSATRSHLALNDSVWRFNLDTVKAGYGGSFTITDSVRCGNVEILGLSQCTKATIYPAPDCPSGNWNGASLSATGKCLGNGLVRVSLAKTGTGDMLDSTSYRIYLDSILVFQKKVKLVQNDSLILQVQANGKLVHVEASQVTNHPTQYSIVLNVEGCGLPSQNISKGFVNKFPLAQSPNSKTHCLSIQGSFDPNDKQVFPIGFTNQNIIPPNTQLEYLVRFQNTGNDTAFTVYVIDTLDTNLNPESLELGAASHNYQLSMQTVKSGKTFLRWQFNNIQLPDSNTNKLKSNGFIQYRISPKANLSLGSKVRNHAEIYFDFNPPIITNQTLSTFGNVVYKDSTLNGNVQIVTALPGKLSPKQIGVNLYPNPVTEHSLTADFQTKGNLTLFNAQGQLVFEKQNIEGKQVLPIQLRTGFYLAQLRTEKGVSVVKVVVE